MNVEFLKNKREDVKQIIKNLDTDISRNELGKEVVDAKILKLKEEIERLEIQIKQNE
jgi:hypothetical protein